MVTCENHTRRSASQPHLTGGLARREHCDQINYNEEKRSARFRGGQARRLNEVARVALLVALTIALLVPRSRAAAPPSNETPDVIVDPQTEQVIKGALRYLAAKQAPAGYWTSGSGNHHA